MSTGLITAPRTLDELLAASGGVALKLSGAGQTAWTGRVIETDDIMLGLAHWDGTLHLDRECILDPLRQMYEHAGEQQPVSTLVGYRESLSTLLHEHAHFLGPAGASQDSAREAFLEPGSRQLEEGVAEAWAQDHLSEYIARLGIDKVAPGIEGVRTVGHYPAFVPAVRTLTTDLETRHDLDPGQVLDALNRETAAGQIPLLVGLVYNSSRLPELEPSGASTRHHLETHLRKGLEHLDTYELHSPDSAAANSQATGAIMLQVLHQQIQSAESAHTPHPTACALPQPARLVPHPLRTALSGVSPPRLLAPSVRAVTPTPARGSAAAVRAVGVNATHTPPGQPADRSSAQQR